MSAMTDYLEDKLLNHTFRNIAFTSPTTVYLALFTSAPGETGGGTEVSGGDYARQSITFGAPSPSGTIKNSADITFPTATADWGTITHVAIFDASTGGNMLVYGALTTSKTVGTGDTFKVSANNLTVTFA